MWEWLNRRIGQGSSGPAAIGFAVLCVAVAAGLLFAIDFAVQQNIRFAPFFPAILLATLFGGWRIGLFATGLSGLIAWWFFIPQRLGFFSLETKQVWALGVYFSVAASVVFIAEKYRQAQRQVDATLQELTHRTKNLLAIILSISEQLGKTSAGTRNFQDRFRDRLMSIALSHDMLVKSRWHTTDLHSTVATAIAQFARKEKVTLSGPDISIPPQMVENIMMAVNELMTNSTKYGALSHRGGRVEISWRLEADSLHFLWRSMLDTFDQSAPVRPGFGTLVLTKIVPRNLQGKADYKIGDGSVTWELVVPFQSHAAS